MKLLADENFNNDILRGLLRENPELDILRVQDSSAFQAEDPIVLEFAASEGRILLTHDVNTMTRYAYDRVRAGLPMPGVIEVAEGVAYGKVISDILIILEVSTQEELENQIFFIPL